MDERERAFDEGLNLLASENTTPKEIERLQLGMIGLLTSENAKNNIPDEEMAKVAKASGCGNGTDNCAGDGEAYDEDADAESRHQGTSRDSLLPSRASTTNGRSRPWQVPSVGGDSVTKALLALGDKALVPVLEQLKSRNSSLRMCSLDMVISLEAPNHLVSQLRIKRANSLVAQ